MQSATKTLRLATEQDVAALARLIERSVQGLQAEHYSASQRESALGTVFGVDRALIAQGSYFVVEVRQRPIGCGGWSRRATLFGVHQALRDERDLVPGVDAARIRAFFVDPAWVRQGVASLILAACERAAAAHGFTRLALAATLTGAPFYRRTGFRDLDHFDTPLPNGEAMPLIAMEKAIHILQAMPVPRKPQ